MKESTKDKLLAIATKHFVEYGYDGARMDMMAQECEYNKATFYYHFKSKDELYKNVLVTIFSIINKELQKLELTNNPKENLKNYVFIVVKTISDNRVYSKLLMSEIATGFKRLNPEALKSAFSMLRVFFQILKSGVESGEFKQITPILPHFMIVGTVTFIINSFEARTNMSNEKIGIDLGLDLTHLDVSEYIFNAVYGAIRS